MFRNMRRTVQELPVSESEEILLRGSYGVLALHGDGGYPYAVPLNYCYESGKIYIHCARAGHKLDAIRSDARASFCVVDRHDVVPEDYRTDYSSVIVFGTVRIVENADEKLRAIEAIGVKYSGEPAIEYLRSGREDLEPLCILELTVGHMSGKEGIELAKNRRNS